MRNSRVLGQPGHVTYQFTQWRHSLVIVIYIQDKSQYRIRYRVENGSARPFQAREIVQQVIKERKRTNGDNERKKLIKPV